MILSGAKIPGLRGYDFQGPSVPLLSVQGTADTSNVPASTYRYFRAAPKPKFLLTLLGAGHLSPYTSQEPQLGIVERVTIAFLDRYLRQMAPSSAAMSIAGQVKGVAALRTAPPRSATTKCVRLAASARASHDRCSRTAPRQRSAPDGSAH